MMQQQLALAQQLEQTVRQNIVQALLEEPDILEFIKKLPKRKVAPFLEQLTDEIIQQGTQQQEVEQPAETPTSEIPIETPVENPTDPNLTPAPIETPIEQPTEQVTPIAQTEVPVSPPVAEPPQPTAVERLINWLAPVTTEPVALDYVPVPGIL
jgi:hypothetical protein